MSLKSKVAKLALENPEMRGDLVPLLRGRVKRAGWLNPYVVEEGEYEAWLSKLSFPGWRSEKGRYGGIVLVNESNPRVKVEVSSDGPYSYGWDEPSHVWPSIHDGRKERNPTGESGRGGSWYDDEGDEWAHFHPISMAEAERKLLPYLKTVLQRKGGSPQARSELARKVLALAQKLRKKHKLDTSEEYPNHRVLAELKSGRRDKLDNEVVELGIAVDHGFVGSSRDLGKQDPLAGWGAGSRLVDDLRKSKLGKHIADIEAHLQSVTGYPEALGFWTVEISLKG
jgi:hypothetical protein